MNKKGFSLVEVLTIIVVLAIITIIAVPKVLVSYENVKKETFRTGATSIVDTVKLVYSQKYEKMTEAETYTFNSGNYAENSPRLSLKGDLPKAGSVYLSTDGTIALAIQSPNEKWCAKKGLNESEITIEDFDKNSCKIDTPSGPIGVHHVVTIEYDRGKAKWTNKSKKIKISSESSFGVNRTTIKYQFSSDGKTNENEWKNYDRTSDGVEVSENGTLFAKLVYIDDETKKEIQLASDSKEGFKIDVTSPTCKFNVKGTKGDDNWYTSDEVKVTLEDNDDQSGINTIQTKINGSINSYNYIIVKNDGTTEVKATVYDNAGNEGTCSTTIKKDSTTPSCTLEELGTIGENGWYTSGVTVVISSDSNISGVSNSGINTSKVPSYGITTFTQTYDTTSTTIYGHVKNNAGKTGTCSTTIKKDSTPPKIDEFAIYEASINSEKDKAGVARVPYYTPAVKAKDDTSGINYVSFYKPETSGPELICADYIKSDSSIKLYSSNDSLFEKNSRKLVNPITNPVTRNVIGICKNIELTKASYTLRAQVCDVAGNCKTSEEEQDIEIKPVRIYVHQLYTKLLGRSAEDEKVVSNWISQFYNNSNFDKESKTLQNIGYCFTMSKTDEVKKIRDDYDKDNDSYKDVVCTGLVGKTCSFDGYSKFEPYVKAILATDGIHGSANALGIRSNKSTTYNCPE